LTTYFVYSDEYGSYTKVKKENFLTTHPYYIRSAVLLDSSEWKGLERQIAALKVKHSLPPSQEIKWSYLWSLRTHSKTNKPIKKTNDYYFLRDTDYHVLIDYVDGCIKAYSQLKYKKILFTVTENSTVGNISEKEIYKMPLTNIAQQLQYELQASNDLAVLFLDIVNKKVDDTLKNVWHGIYSDGDFVKRYSAIKSSAYIEYSHQSVGVQLAGYVSGAIGSFFKSKTSSSYQRGLDMFNSYILPNLRRDKNMIVGYGALNVPTQTDFKLKLREYLDKKNDLTSDTKY